MKFDFAKYYDISKLALEVNPDMYKDYERVFICVDTHTFWLARLMADTNEDYEQEEGTYLLERNNVEKDFKAQKLTFMELVKILEEDDGSNWDTTECHDADDAVDMLDDGFGIGEVIKIGNRWVTPDKAQ